MPENISVDYLGSFAHHKIETLLKNQHVLLLPTKHENFGHVIIESWQNGCPVIISNNTPWKNLESKKVGFNISLKNIKKFISVIEFFSNINQETFLNWSKCSHNYANLIHSSPNNIND